MKWLEKLLEFVSTILVKSVPEPRNAMEDKIMEMGSANEEREIKWKKSPNYSVKPNREISAIILHHTANWNLENAVDWMCDPSARVSAHYCIGTNGSIVQMVLDKHISWHAGRSSLDGRSHVNNYSIGIEMVGNTCEKPLTETQWNAMVWLVQKLMIRHGVGAERVVDHRKISPGRKVDLDPLNFDWLEFYEEIN